MGVDFFKYTKIVMSLSNWSSPFPSDDKTKRNPRKKINFSDLAEDDGLADFKPLDYKPQDYKPLDYKPDNKPDPAKPKNEAVFRPDLYRTQDPMTEKLNYIIHLLEEGRSQKTGHVTEEVILYMFLGVFIIFVLDSFVKTGRYSR